MEPSPVGSLLIDIGGVILTDGWDRQARGGVAELNRAGNEWPA